jgi:hypothetical protein
METAPNAVTSGSLTLNSARLPAPSAFGRDAAGGQAGSPWGSGARGRNRSKLDWAGRVMPKPFVGKHAEDEPGSHPPG